MPAERLPSFQFYPADHLKDPELGTASLAAQGLWVRMLCHMSESSRRGYLASPSGTALTDEQIGRLAGIAPQTARKLIKELEVCGALSRTENGGIIYSRRMVRDEAKRLKFKEFGKMGGNPKLTDRVNPPVKPDANPEPTPSSSGFSSSGFSSSGSISNPTGPGNWYSEITDEVLSNIPWMLSWIQRSEDPNIDNGDTTRERVIGAARKATTDKTVRNPSALFVSIVQNGAWDRVLKEHLLWARERLSKPPTQPAPKRELDDREKREWQTLKYTFGDVIERMTDDEFEDRYRAAQPFRGDFDAKKMRVSMSAQTVVMRSVQRENDPKSSCQNGNDATNA